MASPLPLGLVAGVVVLSGFCSLVYQVVWERTVRFNFGGDSISSAIVAATFLLGLGVGAAVFGRWRARPVTVFAVVQLALGAYAVGSYHVLAPLATLLARLYGLSIADAEGLRLTVVIAAVLFLLPPCVLIGGTLPLIFNCFIRPEAYECHTVGMLYGLNTAGAALGVLAAPFVLLNRLSIPATLLLVGVGNVGLGIVIWLARRAAPPGTAEERARESEVDGDAPLAPLLALSFVGGFISLGFEVSLFRAFQVLNPQSPYNFPAVLVPFLLAMAVGSVVFTRFEEYTPSRALRRIGFLVLLSVLGMLLGILWSSLLSLAGFQVAFRHHGQLWSFFLYCLALAVPLPLLLGGVFPLLLRLASPTGRGLPARTGVLYLANSIGAFTGAMLAQLVGFRLLGTRGVLASLFALGVLAGGACLVVTASRRRSAVLAAMLAAALLVVPLLVPRLSWEVYTFGVSAPDVDRVEGVSGVAMIEWHSVGGAVFVNGQYMSFLPYDSRLLKLVSFALALPRRDQVLLLGLGGGVVVRELVGDTAVRRLDVVDWSYELPLLLEAPRARRHLADAMRSPKVRLCRCDARVSVSLYESAVFDVVIDGLVPANSVGATSVKSVEYFRQIRRILKPSGVFVYAGNYAGVREAVLAGLVTTFPVVREHGREVVLCSDGPIRIDRARAETVLATHGPAIGIPGPPYADWLLTGLHVVSLDQLGPAAPVRDDLLIHEYRHDPLRALFGRRGTGPGDDAARPGS